MSYVLVRANTVVKTIQGDRPLRTAESANGGIRREVAEGVVVYIGGTVTPTGTGKITAISNPNPLTTAARRRIEVKRWLDLAINYTDYYFLRSADANSGAGVSATQFWVTMIGKASALDSNLSSDRTFLYLVNEMNFRPTEWFLYHDNARWYAVDGFLESSPTKFYSTLKSQVQPGHPLYRSEVDMTASDAQFGNLIKYLQD